MNTFEQVVLESHQNLLEVGRHLPMAGGAAPTDRAREGGPVDAVGSFVRRIATLSERHGLDDTDLNQLMIETSKGAGLGRIRRAVDHITQGTTTTDRGTLSEIAIQLEESIDEVIDKSALATRRERVRGVAANAIGAVVGVTCCSFIVGGLAEGDGWLGSPAGLIAFVTVVVILGLFEALHVAGVQIRRVDIDALRDTRPRAVRVHARLRDNAGIDRFLAGRQIVVIFTVFFVARLASFPTLDHIPFSSVGLPAAAKPLVELGIPGALFVLWFGQLLPQFVATRFPLTLLDSRAGSTACGVALSLGGCGLAQPGFWSADLFPDRPQHVPSSARYRWDQAVKEVDGWGVIGIVRRWTVCPGATDLVAQTSIRVSHPNLTHLTDRTMLLSASPRSLSLECDAVDSAGKGVPLAAGDLLEEPLLTGDRRLHKLLIPAVGSFAPGSLVRLGLDAAFAHDVFSDLVHVERPTRFVLFRIETKEQPGYFPPARVSVYAVGDGLTDLVPIGEPIILEPIIGPDGLPRIEYVVAFPRPNTLYRIDWAVSWA